MVAQPVQWHAGFTAPNQQLRAHLAPPPNTRASLLLAEGGSARIVVCRSNGSTDDLDITVDGRHLPVVARPSASD
jgi:hypothetical protein